MAAVDRPRPTATQAASGIFVYLHYRLTNKSVRARRTYTLTLPYTLTLLLAEHMVLSRPALYAVPLCTYFRTLLIHSPGTSDLLGCLFQYSANGHGNTDSDSHLHVDFKAKIVLHNITLQAASLCTYIRAWLIQVSGHVELKHQHRHRPRIRPLVYRRRNTSTVPSGICKYGKSKAEKVLPVHP